MAQIAHVLEPFSDARKQGQEQRVIDPADLSSISPEHMAVRPAKESQQTDDDIDPETLYPVAEMARDFGVNIRTLQRWFRVVDIVPRRGVPSRPNGSDPLGESDARRRFITRTERLKLEEMFLVGQSRYLSAHSDQGDVSEQHTDDGMSDRHSFPGTTEADADGAAARRRRGVDRGEKAEKLKQIDELKREVQDVSRELADLRAQVATLTSEVGTGLKEVAKTLTEIHVSRDQAERD